MADSSGRICRSPFYSIGPEQAHSLGLAFARGLSEACYNSRVEGVWLQVCESHCEGARHRCSGPKAQPCETTWTLAILWGLRGSISVWDGSH